MQQYTDIVHFEYYGSHIEVPVFSEMHEDSLNNYGFILKM